MENRLDNLKVIIEQNLTSNSTATVPSVSAVSAAISAISSVSNAPVADWVAGAQKLNSLVLYNGNIYRVKSNIANGQAVPETNTQYYQLLTPVIPTATVIEQDLSSNSTSSVPSISAVSTAIGTVQNSVAGKVDKVAGKTLSDQNFTLTEKQKLANLQVGGTGGTSYDDTELRGRIGTAENTLLTKVDKVSGKDLSDNNYSTAEKNKLASLNNSDVNKAYVDAADTNLQNNINAKVSKVSGKDLSTNDFTSPEKTKLAGLNNFDDTTLKSRITTAENTLLIKVDKVAGKDLSSNDYTTTEKTKLANLSNYNDSALTGRVTTVENTLVGKVDKVNGKDLSDQNFTLSEKQKLANLQTSSGGTAYDDTELRGRITTAENILPLKVDKVAGKQLSTEDYSTAEKTKLAGLTNSDTNKAYVDAADNALQNNINLKVDKITGKGLSTEDYTTGEKTKLAGLTNFDAADLTNRITSAENELDTKVDKVAGLQLSQENYTTTEKNKLATLVNGDVNKSYVDSADANLQNQISGKVDKVSGKQLTDENFTSAEKTKLASLVNGTSYDDTALANRVTNVENNKVNKVAGKQLTTEDYTSAEKTKLAGLTNTPATVIEQDLTSNSTTSVPSVAAVSNANAALTNRVAVLENTTNNSLNVGTIPEYIVSNAGIQNIALQTNTIHVTNITVLESGGGVRTIYQAHYTLNNNT